MARARWAARAPLFHRSAEPLEVLATRAAVPVPPRRVGAKHGFEDQELLSAAAIVDSVFGGHFDGWWIGGGVEVLAQLDRARGCAGATRVLGRRGIATVGGGSIWRALGNHDLSFYVEPWAAAHPRVTPACPELDGHTYTPTASCRRSRRVLRTVRKTREIAR